MISRAALAAASAALLLLTGCILYSPIDLGSLGSPGPLRETVVMGTAGPKIVLVEISGVISDEAQRSTLGIGQRQSLVAETKSVLELAADDDQVAAILLRIDSPGGSVSASDTIYHEIADLEEREEEAGGGVLQRDVDVGRLLSRDGRRPRGGAPGVGDRLDRRHHARHQHRRPDGEVRRRGPDADERPVQGRRLDAARHAPRREEAAAVGDRRPVRAASPTWSRPVGPLSTKRRFTRSPTAASTARTQALAAGLVDQLGYLEDAVAQVEKRAGISEAQVVVYTRGSSAPENVYSQPPNLSLESLQLALLELRRAQLHPGFYYLWPQVLSY